MWSGVGESCVGCMCNLIVPAGYTVKEEVFLINNESKDYQFTFMEASFNSEGHTGKLKVEPMRGTIRPNSR